MLERVRACCLKYPKCRWVIARSVRRWLTQSALVTWEENVLVGNELKKDRINRDQRSEYRFKNGSRVIVAGLDDPRQVMSAEYDGIFVVEATEISKDTFEQISNRLRYGRMPYQQFLMDCNPSVPTHWLRTMSLEKKITYHEMRHEDNPTMMDPISGQWTPRGLAYIKRLEDNMTGSRLLRLRYGKWAQAEGVVWPEWDSQVNIIPKVPIPASWPRYIAIDFGYTNPLVIQWWAEDPDGALHMYREIYKTQLLVEDAGKWIVREGNWGDPKPRAVICDHDASERASFERHSKLTTKPADKAVTDGIQNVAKRMKKQGNDKPRLFIHRDALVHDFDPELRAAEKPACTAEEIDGYIWDPRLSKKESPLKLNDHGCFVAGTLVETSAGPKAIETVCAGERVLTRNGYRRVLASGMTNAYAATVNLELTNGAKVTATPDHPIWVNDIGFVNMDAMRYNMRVSHCEENEWRSQSLGEVPASFAFDSSASSTGATPRQSTVRIVSTSALAWATKRNMAERIYTATFGLRTTARYRMDLKSIMSMGIRSTTQLKTLNYSRSKNTRRSMARNCQGWRAGVGFQCRQATPAPCRKALPSGTPRTPEESGTPNTARKWPLKLQESSPSASVAKENLSIGQMRKVGFGSVPTNASRQLGEIPALTTLYDHARAESDSRSTSTLRKPTVPVRVLAVTRNDEREAVYNLTVEGEHEFYANGILVHNCDAMRYITRYLDERVSSGANFFDGAEAGYTTRQKNW